MAASSLLSVACAALAILSPSTAFVLSYRGSQRATAVSTASSLPASGGAADEMTRPVSLSPPSSQDSRRDILSKIASSAVGLSSALVVLGPDSAGAFQPGPVTAQSAANKAAYAKSFQGVWADPNHPEGYRVIMASKKGGATMTLCDGVAKDAPEGTEAKTYSGIPVGAKEGSSELTFDFSFSEYLVLPQHEHLLISIDLFKNANYDKRGRSEGCYGHPIRRRAIAHIPRRQHVDEECQQVRRDIQGSQVP